MVAAPPPASDARLRQPATAGETDAGDWERLRAEAADCRRCPLWKPATQTVFGEGPIGAALMLVGEQPGDQEDRQGRPFVGPAGQVLDAALTEAGIDRDGVYVTNAVKHFKFMSRGKRRIHQKPDAGEVTACRWWLSRELAIVRPQLVVAMGATAVLGVLGKSLPIGRNRGRPLPLPAAEGVRVLVTMHPSYILRIPDPDGKERERAALVADLEAARKLVEG